MLDILRDAGTPISTPISTLAVVDAVVDAVVERKELELDSNQLPKLKASIRNTLKSQSKIGLI